MSLESLCVSGFYLPSFSSLCLCWPSTWIFFNIPHLCPVFLSASGCPCRSLLALHTCLFYLYFPLLFHRTAVLFPPTVCLSLPDYCCLVIFSSFLCQKRLGKPLSSLWTIFLRLSYSKWLTPSSFPKSFICFARKRKEAFKKCPAFRVKFFSRVNLRAAQRDPGGVNEQKEWKACFLWVEWGFEREDLCFIADYTATFFLRNCRLHRSD